jgi:acetyl esterase/lipase
MPSEKSIEIRKTIKKDELHLDIPIAQRRREWEEAARQVPPLPGIEAQAKTIGGVPCLWVREHPSHDEYVIIYIHGGGLTEGSALTTREFGSRLTKVIQIPFLIVDYRLAPEHPFPAALEDVKAVYKDLLKDRYKPEQIIFGGDSSGGGLALATVIALRDEGEKLPASMFLISASVDLTLSGESMRTRADIDPFTSIEALKHSAELYSGGADLRTPLISPLFADVSRLPPTLIQVGDHEILLSDSTRLAEKMNESGSKATLKVWDAMWHVWHYYADLPESQQAMEEIREFIYQNLQTEN